MMHEPVQVLHAADHLVLEVMGVEIDPLGDPSAQRLLDGLCIYAQVPNGGTCWQALKLTGTHVKPLQELLTSGVTGLNMLSRYA